MTAWEWLYSFILVFPLMITAWLLHALTFVMVEIAWWFTRFACGVANVRPSLIVKFQTGIARRTKVSRYWVEVFTMPKEKNEE